MLVHVLEAIHLDKAYNTFMSSSAAAGVLCYAFLHISETRIH